jgi:hypothetical protein
LSEAPPLKKVPGAWRAPGRVAFGGDAYLAPIVAL